MPKFYYEIRVRANEFVDETTLEELNEIIAEWFEGDARVESEHVDSDFG